MKVARTIEEIPELYDSAVREAVAAFGRGECFVERYLDNPRHVETQVLADQHGNVVVVSTRDCSLQRRHQKLVEEAPAPYLSEAQLAELYRASKAIVKEAGYFGAGTCEFLVGVDGTISFLEVNTRLQVEHPVSEEVAGIDLVREQFRIANGEALGFDDPVLRGHSFEFRINGEDPGRSFLPGPGVLTVWNPPSGPGVRLDAGFQAGDVIGGNFDSLLAKLIVTGRNPRGGARALAPRARRVRDRGHRHGADLPPRRGPRPRVRHRRRDPVHACTPGGSRPSSTTRSRRTPVQRPTSPSRRSARRSPSRSAASGSRSCFPAGSLWGAAATPAPRRLRSARRRSPAAPPRATPSPRPMQGTIVKVAVEEGQQVEAGELVVVLEAMKMEQPLTAHKAGTVTGLAAEVGATVPSGTVLLEIKD